MCVDTSLAPRTVSAMPLAPAYHTRITIVLWRASHAWPHYCLHLGATSLPETVGLKIWPKIKKNKRAVGRRAIKGLMMQRRGCYFPSPCQYRHLASTAHIALRLLTQLHSCQKETLREDTQPNKLYNQHPDKESEGAEWRLRSRRWRLLLHHPVTPAIFPVVVPQD